MKIKSGTDDSKVWHDEKAQIEIATEKMSERPYARCMYFFQFFITTYITPQKVL